MASKRIKLFNRVCGTEVAKLSSLNEFA